MNHRPWVNYHHLLYFKTIAQEGGIARAAKKLRLGQPTLSTQLKQFESVLGYSLFDRNKRKLYLTEAGQVVLDYATEIFKLGDEMVDTLNDRLFHDKMQVQIGVVDTVPRYLILKLFQLISKKFECITSISSGHASELMRELRAHNLDIMITNEDPRTIDSGGIFPKRIANMPVAVCGNKSFIRLKKNFPTSLQGAKFALPGLTTKLRQNLDHYFRQFNIQVENVGDIHDTALQKMIATHSDVLLAIAKPAVEELISDKELIEIGLLRDVHEELWIVSGQRRQQNPVAAFLMSELEF